MFDLKVNSEWRRQLIFTNPKGAAAGTTDPWASEAPQQAKKTEIESDKRHGPAFRITLATRDCTHMVVNSKTAHEP
jgi:hypothetical protein